jgi:hypothetical protein
MWRNTPHGRAFVPPQPVNPVRPIGEALQQALGPLLARIPAAPAA